MFDGSYMLSISYLFCIFVMNYIVRWYYLFFIQFREYFMRFLDWYLVYYFMQFYGILEQKRVYNVGYVIFSFENIKYYGEFKEDQFWGRKVKCLQREVNDFFRIMRRNRRGRSKVFSINRYICFFFGCIFSKFKVQRIIFQLLEERGVGFYSLWKI